MFHIHAGKIKAARAILNWSQGDLACAANLSINTIRTIESGAIIPRTRTGGQIKCAIEKAGIEFIDAEGVRRHMDEVNLYSTPDSCDMLFHDIMQTIGDSNSDVVAILPSQKVLAESFGIQGNRNAARFAKLRAIAHMRCIISETSDKPVVAHDVQLRVLVATHVQQMNYYVFGNKLAFIVSQANGTYRFVVIKSLFMAQSFRLHFASLWEHAVLVSA